jgi:hypothetical protein
MPLSTVTGEHRRTASHMLGDANSSMSASTLTATTRTRERLVFDLIRKGHSLLFLSERTATKADNDVDVGTDAHAVVR